MTTELNIKRVPIGDLKKATYNPRKELIPGDPEYEKLARSIHEFGLLEPIVWNKRTGNVVGGHQRLSVLENDGATEVDVVVVDMDETREKLANLALNKISGDWDFVKLAELLIEDLGSGDVDLSLSGFDEIDVEKIATYSPNYDEPKVEAFDLKNECPKCGYRW